MPATSSRLKSGFFFWSKQGRGYAPLSSLYYLDVYDQTSYVLTEYMVMCLLLLLSRSISSSSWTRQAVQWHKTISSTSCLVELLSFLTLFTKNSNVLTNVMVLCLLFKLKINVFTCSFGLSGQFKCHETVSITSCQTQALSFLTSVTQTYNTNWIQGVTIYSLTLI